MAVKSKFMTIIELYKVYLYAGISMISNRWKNKSLMTCKTVRKVNLSSKKLQYT